MEIVGVAADATYLSIRSGVPPTMYVPMTQQTEAPASMSLSVRSETRPPSVLVRDVVDMVERVGRNLGVTFTPLDEQILASVVQERVVAMLAGLFGGLALLLAGLGLYGTTWYAVSRRRTEIGIRMAVGAAPSHVVRLVFVRVVFIIGLGTLLGTGLSLWTSALVSPLLYGLEPRDPVTTASSALVLAIVGSLAGWLPAHRASRIDPSSVLRDA
jgi:ABC-type antimicrobial peptide transport system permease subunit